MKEVKLTRKEQALLSTFKKPYSVNELVSKIDVITQNLLKYIYEDISAGADMIQEKRTRVIPAQDREIKVVNVILGARKNGENLYIDSKEIEHEEEYERTEVEHQIGCLRFNNGTATVGIVIDNIHYVHNKFYDSFKDKPRIALNQYIYYSNRYSRGFVEDDFPRERMLDYEEIDRIGDWVICTNSGYEESRDEYLTNQRSKFQGYDHWINKV